MGEKVRVTTEIVESEIRTWNSNTPFPKRYKKGKCSMEKDARFMCAGSNCRFIKKNCLYSRMKTAGKDRIDSVLARIKYEEIQYA